MSGDARPQAPDDDGESAWRPSGSLDRSPGEAFSGIREGFEKIVEGGSEATGAALLLILLFALRVLGEDADEDSESMTLEERNAKWDELAKPVQERFEDNNVDEEEVEDAILSARSEQD